MMKVFLNGKTFFFGKILRADRGTICPIGVVDEWLCQGGIRGLEEKGFVSGDRGRTMLPLWCCGQEMDRYMHGLKSAKRWKRRERQFLMHNSY